ncbi:MAG: class C sortase [Lachnospiraceae bacterium]|nr:class C sortase [Lachnospiraceae bacterium]
MGVCLILYPSVSNYWNEINSARASGTYLEQMENVGAEAYQAIRSEAEAYNRDLLKNTYRWGVTDEDHERYQSTLKVGETETIGIIQVPRIKLAIPIRHGTEEETLRTAIGHFEGSSLPVGGASTHCVLTGHRGLPSAKLFSDLDQLSAGDRFTLTVLGDVLTYEIDRILTVEPEDLAPLAIEEGRDLCTLVTCTPYGVNTHRLLVRGHRVQQEEQSEIRVISDAVLIEPEIVAPVIGALIAAFLLAGMFLAPFFRYGRKRLRPDQKSNKKNEL